MHLFPVSASQTIIRDFCGIDITDPPSRDAQLGGGRGGLPPPMLAEGHFLPPQIFEVGGKILGAKPPKFGAGGAVLENFGRIFVNLWLKNAIKIDFLDFQKKFWIPLVKRQKNEF